MSETKNPGATQRFVGMQGDVVLVGKKGRRIQRAPASSIPKPSRPAKKGTG